MFKTYHSRPVWSRQASGNFDIVVTGWGADFADPISFDDLFTSKNAQNTGKWANGEYDKLIASSKTATNDESRFSDLVKAEKILLKDQGIVHFTTKLQLGWFVHQLRM